MRGEKYGLDAEVAAELQPLGEHWGLPAVHTASRGSAVLWNGRSRRREVCIVVRRRSGKLLTFTKTFYPPGTYRLLTGGVEPGEDVIDAPLREVAEESGLDIAIRRFLALIAYLAKDDAEGRPHMFTFAFLLDEIGGTLHSADPSEHVAGFSETDIPGLAEIVDRLDRLSDTYSPEFGESWRDGGHFAPLFTASCGRFSVMKRCETVRAVPRDRVAHLPSGSGYPCTAWRIPDPAPRIAGHREQTRSLG